ncbi:hypothetical protein Tco_0233803 [Tanacetum coccineum]
MIAQDAPSTSHSLSSLQVHPPVFPQGVAAGPAIEDTSITQADLHPSVNLVEGEPSSTQSTSGDVNEVLELIDLKYGKLVPRPPLRRVDEVNESVLYNGVIDWGESVCLNLSLWAEFGKCNRVLERQKKLRNQIFRAITTSADVPSSVTEITNTTSTLPPTTPLLNIKDHRDIGEIVKDQNLELNH